MYFQNIAGWIFQLFCTRQLGYWNFVNAGLKQTKEPIHNVFPSTILVSSFTIQQINEQHNKHHEPAFSFTVNHHVYAWCWWTSSWSCRDLLPCKVYGGMLSYGAYVMLQTAQDRFDVVHVLKKHSVISIDGTTTNDCYKCQMFPRLFGNYGANFSGHSPILEPPGSMRYLFFCEVLIYIGMCFNVSPFLPGPVLDILLRFWYISHLS